MKMVHVQAHSSQQPYAITPIDGPHASRTTPANATNTATQPPVGPVLPPTGVPVSLDGIHVTLPWVHTDADASRHQFSPTKVSLSPKAVANEMPKPPVPSEERLRELASPRVQAAVPPPRSTSPFYTGLGPTASPNTFSELAAHTNVGATSKAPAGSNGASPRASRAARRTISHSNTGMHTAFGSRVKPTPPKLPAKGRPSGPNSSSSRSGTATRRASYSAETSSSLLRKGKPRPSAAFARNSVDSVGGSAALLGKVRSSVDSVGSSALLGRSNKRAPTTRSFMGSSAPTDRAAPSRSVQGGTPRVPKETGKRATAEAVAVQNQAAKAPSPPISVSLSSIHGDNSILGATSVDGQQLNLSPSIPLTAAAAATAAAATDSLVSASAKKLEGTPSNMQRMDLSSGDTQREGLSPFSNPRSRPETAASAVPRISDAFAGLGRQNSPHASSAGNSSKHAEHAVHASPAAPVAATARAAASAPSEASGRGKEEEDNEAKHRGELPAARDATSFAEPVAPELSGLLDDSRLVPAPMDMINSMMGSVVDDVVPVSTQAGAPDSMHNTAHATHAYGTMGHLCSEADVPSSAQALPTRGKHGGAEAALSSHGAQRQDDKDAAKADILGEESQGGEVAADERGSGGKGAVRNAGGENSVGLVRGTCTGKLGQLQRQGSKSNWKNTEKQSMVGRLCGLLPCCSSSSDGRKQAEQPRQAAPDLSVLASGHVDLDSTFPSAENTGQLAQPIPPRGMSPPDSLTPTPIPRLPEPSLKAPAKHRVSGSQLEGKAGSKHAVLTARGGAATPSKPAPAPGGTAKRPTGNLPEITASTAATSVKSPGGRTSSSVQEPKARVNNAAEAQNEPQAQLLPTASDGSNAAAPNGGPGLLGATDSMLSTAGGVAKTPSNNAEDEKTPPVFSTSNARAQGMFNTADGVQKSAHGTANVAQQSLFSTADKGQQPLYNTVDVPHDRQAAYLTAPHVDSDTELASQLLPQIAGQSAGFIEATMLSKATLPARIVL